MKPSWYADVTESRLTYSLGEANERRGLELRHHSQCFMKLLSSQLFKITTPQIFAICWFKISGFYHLQGTPESVISRNLPFFLRIPSLGRLMGRSESPSQEWVQYATQDVSISVQLCPSPLHHYSGSWGFLRFQDASLENIKGPLWSWSAGAPHSWKFILSDSMENWMKRETLSLPTVLIHSINKLV